MEAGTTPEVQELEAIMFGRSTRANRRDIDVEKYRAQAHEAAEAAKEAAHQAAVSARKAANRAQEWAEPQYEAAKEWATPRAKRAYRTGARKVQPLAHRAGGAAEHWADVAHAAIVGAAIPAVLGAVDNAARDEDERHGMNWAALVVPVALAAAAGAALVIWARRDPGRDRWAGEDDEWEFDGDADFTQNLRDGINKAADTVEDAAKKAVHAAAAAAAAAGDVVVDKAGPTYQKVRDAAGPAAERVREEAAKVAEKAGPAVKQARDRVAETVDSARHRVAVGVAGTVDDLEDVWDDETDDAAKKSAPKKPAAKKPAPKSTSTKSTGSK